MIREEKPVYFTLKNIKNFEEFKEALNLFSSEKINNNISYSVIIDGKTLSYLERLDENLKDVFLNILTDGTTAICCRLTPKQKAQLTKMLKKEANKVVLCVGDGANDVPMIMESSIGIGISGMEGTQVNI